MSTEPLTFPNLVTGFERNPQHAARAALYTRYTPTEWHNNFLALLAESDAVRSRTERFRCDTVRLMRETDERTSEGQRDTGRRIGERITDVTFWRNELNTELEKLVAESSRMQHVKLGLMTALQDLEGPLHIAQECLYHREGRKGVEKTHDDVEKALLIEVDNLRSSQKKLQALFERVIIQEKFLESIYSFEFFHFRLAINYRSVVQHNMLLKRTWSTKNQQLVLIHCAIN